MGNIHHLAKSQGAGQEFDDDSAYNSEETHLHATISGGVTHVTESQTADGGEAYTRNGSLKLDENGVLQTHDGLNVMGDGGPLSIPPGRNVAIGKDGTLKVEIDTAAAKRDHPDNQHTGNATQFDLLVKAHTVLTHPERRAAYEDALEKGKQIVSALLESAKLRENA